MGDRPFRVPVVEPSPEDRVPDRSPDLPPKARHP
jgi:hypothetical protein